MVNSCDTRLLPKLDVAVAIRHPRPSQLSAHEFFSCNNTIGCGFFGARLPAIWSEIESPHPMRSRRRFERSPVYLPSLLWDAVRVTPL